MSGAITVNLFSKHGEVVATIPVGDPAPGIVVWNGLYFHLENGRYVQATVWHHIG
jgi:hypothetical protein